MRGKSMQLKKHHEQWSKSCLYKGKLSSLCFTNFETFQVKGYLQYKTVTSQNVSLEAQVKKFLIS